MRALVVQLALLGLVACRVDVDFDNTRFMCADGECPSGYECVAEVCVLAEGDVIDGGGDDSDGGGGAVDGPVALAACHDQFGAVPGYELCAENADTCEFFHATGDGTQVTCADVCPMYDSTCVQSYDSSVGETQCTRDTAEEGCTVAHSSQLCVCARSPI